MCFNEAKECHSNRIQECPVYKAKRKLESIELHNAISGGFVFTAPIALSHCFVALSSVRQARNN